MKKNRMMRVASALLVAVLLTTCAISGTFAKYVTGADADSSARVAKFGVEVTAEVAPFLAEYDADVTALDQGDVAIAKTVVAYNGTDLLVAPGTSGDLGATTITGTPEVAVNVKKEATLTLEKWEDKTGYYCPIIITVNGVKFDGTTYSSAADFIADVEAAIEVDVNYAPNTTLNSTDDVAITWAWAFDDSKADAAAGQNDVSDTYLGDAADDGNAATIALELVTTVTQID